MEDLSLLGNAAAVPVIIAITQFLKKNFKFKRKADVISLLVSLAVCIGWEFYYTSTEELIVIWGGGIIASTKHVIHLMLVSGATWLSASKSYDIFVGDKKKLKEIDNQLNKKKSLQNEVEDFKRPDEARNHAGEEDVAVDEKIRDILEGR